jgi:rubrerythrin
LYSANGEDDEIEVMYPGFILQADGEGRSDAAASFRLALEREKHHRAMFKQAPRVVQTNEGHRVNGSGACPE